MRELDKIVDEIDDYIRENYNDVYNFKDTIMKITINIIEDKYKNLLSTSDIDKIAEIIASRIIYG